MRRLVPISSSSESTPPRAYLCSPLDLYYKVYFCSIKNAARFQGTSLSDQSVRSNTCSGGVEHTLSQQVQLGPSIHLAFEELEPGHLALRLSIAVRKLEGGAYSG